MNTNERIKMVRKSIEPLLSQARFGETIGLTRDMVNNIENNRVDAPEAIVRLVSSTYRINYQWLKDGVGPMYLPPDTDDELVDEVMAGENEFAKSVFRAFAKLGDEEWLMLKRIVELIQSKD